MYVETLPLTPSTENIWGKEQILFFAFFFVVVVQKRKMKSGRLKEHRLKQVLQQKTALIIPGLSPILPHATAEGNKAQRQIQHRNSTFGPAG